MRLLMIEPRGFCAGVERAINIVDETLKVMPTPIYVNHEIVHNSHIIKHFEDRGVIFTEDITSIPSEATLIFNAHGVSPSVVYEAQAKNLKIIDATCPLVNKVHLEVLRYARQEYQIVLIGHANHPEVIGVIGHSPQRIHLIETINDIKKLPFDKNTKLAYVTQTTLSTNDCRIIVESLKEHFPQITGPQKSDICYATTNRQDAIRAVASSVDVVIVIGSTNSSNSNRLCEVARSSGCTSFLINHPSDIDIKFLQKVESVAISAGASTPENIIQEVVQYLKKNLDIDVEETFTHQQEDIRFSLPKIN